MAAAARKQAARASPKKTTRAAPRRTAAPARRTGATIPARLIERLIDALEANVAAMGRRTRRPAARRAAARNGAGTGRHRTAEAQPGAA